MNRAFLGRAAEIVRDKAGVVTLGRVVRATGLLLEAHVHDTRIGDLLEIEGAGGRVVAEVVGFRDGLGLAIPFSDVRGVSPGARVRHAGEAAHIPVGDALLGRVVDPFGEPLDGGPAPRTRERAPVVSRAPLPPERARIDRRFETGIRVIDGLLPCGRGQRVGLFAGAGVGKTSLMRQIAGESRSDVTVIGLIGERGCEVHDMLRVSAREKTVTVVSTSDRSPMERARGALAATAVAEHFRDRGANVLLIIDSLTRYAMALREIGLAAGEPPASKGYPPSVFAALPRLLERVSPMGHGGSITGFYTVLVEGDDLADPVADSARSLLDGHLVLSRDLAARGHFPALDVLASASRVAAQVSTRPALVLAQRVRALLARRKEVEDLRSLGAYVPGANPEADLALQVGKRLDGWAVQETDERSEYARTMADLDLILGGSAT